MRHGLVCTIGAEEGLHASFQSIWQDTLTESIQSGLTAEEGFELLCERMAEWEKDY